MDLDRLKVAIREALRPELQKLAERKDGQAEKDAIALTEGAKYRLLQKQIGLPDLESQHRGYFAMGARLVDRLID